MPASSVRAESWNAFANSLARLHRARNAERPLRTEEEIGSYVGWPQFYREVREFDAASGRLLAVVRWERTRPEILHAIQLFVRDAEGRVVRDYDAAFLPGHRNAPIRTLINLHAYNGGLHAFRQFDASGMRLYERCRGKLAGAEIDIELELIGLEPPPDVARGVAYKACFGGLPEDAGRYRDPLVETVIAVSTPERSGVAPAADPRAPLVAEGAARFRRGEFAPAVEDLTAAIAADAADADAYFWRGMALGRMGRIAEGIRDLDEFLARRPESSLGYGKRGIRHLWNGDRNKAEADFRRAIELDPANAEAHDDLGVILALRGEFVTASDHFATAARIDPSYRKAHHNLAMTRFLAGRYEEALAGVDRALALEPSARESTLLKSEILDAMGRGDEARRLKRRASGLTETDWSERMPLD